RAEERAMEFSSRQGRRRHPGPPPESLPKLDEMNPKEALSEWLNRRASARASQKTTPAAEPPPSRNREKPVAEASREPEKEVMQPPAAETKQSSVFIDESLWDSILGQSRARKQGK